MVTPHLFSIDTWGFEGRNADVDIIDYGLKSVDEWPIKNSRPLAPVPFAAPGHSKLAFNSLPRQEKISRRSKQHVRSNMGISDSEKLVLFCTSPWQHARFDSDLVLTISKNVPVALIKKVIATPGLTLVHVGPEAYPELDEDSGYK